MKISYPGVDIIFDEVRNVKSQNVFFKKILLSVQNRGNTQLKIIISHARSKLSSLQQAFRLPQLENVKTKSCLDQK